MSRLGLDADAAAVPPAAVLAHAAAAALGAPTADLLVHADPLAPATDALRALAAVNAHAAAAPRDAFRGHPPARTRSRRDADLARVAKAPVRAARAAHDGAAEHGDILRRGHAERAGRVRLRAWVGQRARSRAATG